MNRPFDSLFNDFDSIDSTVNNMNSHFASFSNKDSINISEYPIDKKSGDDCLELVDEFDVYRYLSRLSTHKAIGADDIPNIIYREAFVFVAKPLLHIINTCLLNHTFPTVLTEILTFVRFLNAVKFLLAISDPFLFFLSHLRPLNILYLNLSKALLLTKLIDLNLVIFLIHQQLVL